MPKVRAKYEKGVLTPLEPLDLEEGKEVTVFVGGDAPALSANGQEASSTASSDEPRRSKGLLGIVELARELQKSMPPEEFGLAPPDGAKNYKHYLHGRPKVED